MNFEECFEKHFPVASKHFSLICCMNGTTIKDETLMMLRSYKGDYYNLDDSLLGALIIHVKLGNIKSYNIFDLINRLNWPGDFNNDVLCNLKSDYNPNDSLATVKDLGKNDNTHNVGIGKYDFDEVGNYEEGGGYNTSGHNRSGHDVDGLDEYGYDEDLNDRFD